MNNLLQAPIGIDFPIQMLQTYLYENLYTKWGTSGLTAETFDMYGRIYRNKSKDGFVPQWYSEMNEYSHVLFHNDRIAVHMYFGLSDPTRVDSSRYEYTVNLYCYCNIDMLYPDGENRLDEYVIDDVARLIANGNRYGFFIQGIYRDVDNVMSKFSGGEKNLAQIKSNMHPKLCFRIEMKNAININVYTTCTAPLATPLYFNAMTGSIQAQFLNTPNTSLTQTLVNGVKIQLQYETGNTLTIPHLAGRYVFPDVILDGTVYSTIAGSNNYMAYDLITQTFTFGSDYPNDGFQEGSIFIIKCNENS